MSTARKIDANGFLLVQGCPLSSVGIFEYSAGQLELPGDPNRIVKVFRPESSVNDPQAIESFRNVPLINDHEMLSGFKNDKESTAPEDYGVSGILTSNIYYEAPWLRGDIKVFARDMQDDLAKGKKDLSLGYSCDFEEKPGVWQGQAYELVQINIRGNHIALVGEGRVPGARILDGLCFDHMSLEFKQTEEPTMSKALKQVIRNKAVRDSAVAKLQQLVPALSSALQEFLQEEGSEPEHQGAAPASGADEGTEDPNAAPAAAADPAVGATDPSVPADPANVDPDAPQGAAESAPDVGALIAQAQQLLANLQAACGGGATTDAENGQMEDQTEGLQESTGVNGAQVSTDEGVTESEKGATPSVKPSVKAEDAALARFYADSAAKDRLYNRLSATVGTFDCKAMDARQVAVYGVKKLGIKCADGLEAVTIEAYLNGIEAAAKKTKQAVQTRVADSAVSNVDMDAYLNGSK